MTDRTLWRDMEPGLQALAPCHFADLSGMTDIEATARDLLERVPGPLVPIGFSMGGFVAREMALAGPDRVRGLVLMGTSARPTRPEIQARNAALIRSTRERGYRGLSPAAVRKGFHPATRDTDPDVDFVLQMAMRMGPQAFINQLSLDRRDGRPHLADIKCPTLVIWPRQDEMRSLKESEELANGIPGARLEIIEDCGHMMPLEKPQECLRLIGELLAQVS